MHNQGVVLVTGASSGIGNATVLAFAEAGFAACATARKLASLAGLAERGIETLPLDVTDEASMSAAVRTIEARHGAIDVLVNNAGLSELGPIEEVPLERARLEFETNVFGPMRLSQLVIPGMRRKGHGRIVNLSSMGGEFSTPFSGVYHASKFAIEAISDALRFEVEPFGIGVIVIQPGVVQTPMGEKTAEAVRAQASRPESAYAAQMGRFRQFLEDNNPDSDGTAARPEEVAQVILKAVQAPRPETRYKIGEEAERLPKLRRSMSDREWDAIYRKVFG